MQTWKTYSPTKQSQWNARRVAHLHRRAVFGLTASELNRDVNSSPEESVSRIVAGEGRDGTPAEFEDLANVIGEAAAGQEEATRLKAWWIYRILFSPDPLTERLTFMWHNHFATSNGKVKNLLQIKTQNQTLRTHSRGEFGTLLNSMLCDPALLRWLDAPTNRKGRPNENLGRELLELFTLGVGNFVEADVKNASRALTGLRIKDREYHFDPKRHDGDAKTILGETRDFGPDQLTELLLSKPATARRIADKLIAEFFAPQVVSTEARNELASQLMASKLNIGQAVETILRSDLFFSEANINKRIADPLSFLIAPLRSLEVCDSAPKTLWLADWLRRMGLDLFYPPNVAGWPGGRNWMTTRAVIARSNYCAALLSGELHQNPNPPNLDQLGKKHNATESKKFASLMQTLLLGDEIENDQQKTNPEFLSTLMTGPKIHLH